MKGRTPVAPATLEGGGGRRSPLAERQKTKKKGKRGKQQKADATRPTTGTASKKNQQQQNADRNKPKKTAQYKPDLVGLAGGSQKDHGRRYCTIIFPSSSLSLFGLGMGCSDCIGFHFDERSGSSSFVCTHCRRVCLQYSSGLRFQAKHRANANTNDHANGNQNAKCECAMRMRMRMRMQMKMQMRMQMQMSNPMPIPPKAMESRSPRSTGLKQNNT